MKNLRLLALLAVLLPVGVQGQETSDVTWKEFVSAEGGFVVTLPDGPLYGLMRDSRYMGESDVGKEKTRMGDRVRAVIKGVIFEVSFTPLTPEEAKQKKAVIANTTISNMPPWGDPLCQTKFKINGHPAVDTLFVNSGGVYFLLRQFATNDRYYYIIVENKDRGASVAQLRSAEVDRFLNSFKLTEKKTR